MTKMIATKAMRYAGKSLPAGAEFSTKGKSHARLLQALGRAQPAPEVAAAPPPAAVLVAASKRVYKRKDMVAEDDERKSFWTPPKPLPPAMVAAPVVQPVTESPDATES
jgi:hypothetical protein